MKVLKTINIILLTICLFTSCYYDVEEDLYTTVECMTEEMSYSDDIVPIIESNCNACHSAGANFGGITLEGHNKIKEYVDNESLLGAIKHDAGFSPMPKNTAKLIQCEIEKIETWIQNGALNN